MTQGLQHGDHSQQTNIFGPVYYATPAEGRDALHGVLGEPVRPEPAGRSHPVDELPLVWRVPPRNPAFTGREATLADLRIALARGGRVAVRALHGIGGVGKTSLAVEYVHRFASDFEAVWWVDAQEPTLIGEQFREPAMAVGVAGQDADARFAVSAAHTWLRQHARWVMVFDNAEDPAAIMGLLPEGPGQVLITSRDPRWESAVTATEPIDVFDRPESISLLQARAASLGPEQADRVAEALGDLPLAVAQAAAFLHESRIDVEDYLDELQRHAASVMTEGTPAGYPQPLAAAIRLTLEAITADNEAGIQLLQVLAFLAPEPVPVVWFSGARTMMPPALAAAATSQFRLHRAVAGLNRVGLVRLSIAGEPVLHRLTAAIVRDTPDQDGAPLTQDHAEAVLAANAPGPPRDPSTWSAWADFTVHLLSLDPARTNNPDLRQLALDAVFAQLVRADTRSAHTLSGGFLEAWQPRYGAEHPNVLTAVSHLAWANSQLGDHRTARKLDEETLILRRRVLGEEHPDSLWSASNLAVDLFELGEFAAARQLDEKTLAVRRRVLGIEHPDTLRSANNLAGDLRGVGEFAAARELDEGTLAVRRRVLGPEHPESLWSANNLARDLCGVGEFAAARQLDEETLMVRRRVLGPEHPDTLESTKNLA